MPEMKAPQLSENIARVVARVDHAEALNTIAEWFTVAEDEIVAACGDLDDEEFLPPTEVARRSALFVAKQMAELSLAARGEFLFPALEPTASGGVDLHWKTSRGELLIGIPAKDEGWVQYYGDTPNGVVTKGRMPAAVVVNVLVSWIAQFL